MADLLELLALPLETLAIVVLGYASYRVAFTGKDSSHAAVDVVFMSLAFSLAAKAGMVLGNQIATGLGYLAAVVCALAAAVIWRRLGEGTARKTLRWAAISNSDRSLTAWERISNDPSLKPSQLIVRRRDGRLLMCERLADFSKESLGPCIYGPDGSVALFVTHERGPDDADWVETPNAADGNWGRLITCLPAAEVAAIYLRHPTLT